jgi:hypothetical protein
MVTGHGMATFAMHDAIVFYSSLLIILLLQLTNIGVEVTTELLKRLKVPSLKKPLKANWMQLAKGPSLQPIPLYSRCSTWNKDQLTKLSVLQILLLQAKHEKS